MGDSQTTLEILHDERTKAKHHLETVKAHQVKRWENESYAHWLGRVRLHHKRRKNVRKILENFDTRIEDAKQRKQERIVKSEGQFDPHGGNIVSFDGKTVVEWLAHDLLVARQHGWGGYLVSGYRTPEYSESLCYGMCGAPSCPGRCAGRASKHSESGYLGGAADISDYINGERILHETGSRAYNDLPYDLVHMSATGH
ncbi:MAG: hypothetical protein H0U55_11725 [Rubrobacteraceae bacterium]|nr:hypothetical protein [Rubrobacteraceae bacterium]